LVAVSGVRAPSGPTTAQASDFITTSGLKKLSVNEPCTVTSLRSVTSKVLGSR
jgi:hypothetical protein